LIDDKLIGGFSELTELHMDGELDQLMKHEWINPDDKI
jgi:hypothetical protein